MAPQQPSPLNIFFAKTPSLNREVSRRRRPRLRRFLRQDAVSVAPPTSPPAAAPRAPYLLPIPLFPLHSPLPLSPTVAAPRVSPRPPPAAARGSRSKGEIRVAGGDGRRFIPIARCYEAGLARLEVAGAARRGRRRRRI
jgi:hypothetical protein